MTQVMTSQQEKYQKCKIYAEMQWTFGIQAIPDTCDTKY